MDSTSLFSSMDKSRHDKHGGVGVGGRLKQRLAQMLLHSPCAAATAFVGPASATTTNAAAPAPASRQEPPPPPRTRRIPRGAHAHDHEPRSSKAGGGDASRSCQRRHQHHRRRGAQALVHISIDCSARSSVGAAVLPSPVTTRIKGDGGSRLPLSRSYGWSSSSSSWATDTDGEAAPYRSEGADTRSSTLFSSRSFSSDSTSDFYGATSNNTRPRRRNKPLPRRAPAADAFPGEHGRKGERRSVNGTMDIGDAMEEAAARAPGSTAVVKRSRNPYADFRRSMVEMVAGRRIREADALSELLVWYLSLNSPRHHPAILAAFEDVWEAVLGTDP